MKNKSPNEKKYKTISEVAKELHLVDKKTDEILGAHIIGHDAGQLIAEIVTTIEFGGSAEDIARVCHAHPTTSPRSVWMRSGLRRFSSGFVRFFHAPNDAQLQATYKYDHRGHIHETYFC